MNGWSPLLDAVLVLLPVAGMALGWQVRSEKADRNCDRAYKRGLALGWRVCSEKVDRDCDRAYKRGYADAVRHHGR